MKPDFQSDATKGNHPRSVRHITIALVCVGMAACIAIVLFSLDTPTHDEARISPVLASETDDLIQPVKAWANLDPRKVALGSRFFHDTRLSHDNTVACASCHNLKRGGTDGRVRAIGINNTVGPVATPTVLNACFNFRQFWDGRAESLEDQVDGPVQNPAEMGSTWPEVIAKLRAIPEYARAYQEIYSGPVQAEGIRLSIAEYERSLTTPGSRFDRFLRGDTQILSGREKEGYKLFKSLGCVSCHQGEAMGGNMYQKLGTMAPYFEDRGNVTKADLGRYNVTGNEQDKYMFKVPTLRNIALTAPYFHDGNAKTLSEAVRMMGKYQLGRDLAKSETELLVEFLNTLTGELNGTLP